LCVVNTSNVVWIYFSNLIDSYSSLSISSNHFDWDNPQSIFSYQIDFDNQQNVCSQIKMNFFAQNLREVSANLVKNFDTVFF